MLHLFAPIKNLNRLTWLIVIVFITVIFTMEYFSPGILWEGIVVSVPLIIAAIWWSEKTGCLMERETGIITKRDSFYQDLFLITYCFFLGVLCSLIFQCNNSDVKGWWPLIIYIMGIYGFVFALCFSFVALFLDKHKIYTIVFLVIIFFAFLLSNFWPMYLQVLYLGDVSSFSVIYFTLIGAHLLFCSVYKLYVFLYRIIYKKRY